MSKVLLIGAGGVGSVVAHKISQTPETFTSLVIASRTVARCEKIKAQIQARRPFPIETAQVDADHADQVARLIALHKPKLVINTALPYQDLSIMDACLEMGVDYLDTANYEPPDVAKFEYKWQWDYQARFRERGLMALLGCGFDPGVTNIFCAHAQKHHFDEIHYVDIVDCNAGNHGYPFATNFNPEINIREITAKGRYWENGDWVETEPMAMHKPFDAVELGRMEIYLMYHEELESLCKNLQGLKRIRFWMSFSENYLTHLRVLENVGMTSIEPITFQGQQIVPLQFLKAMLPDPASLGPRTKGKTNIGCFIEGIKDGTPKKVHVYNVCDHEEAYRETDNQAISYTTGVPAFIGAKLMLEGKWRGQGVFNVEEMDPDPFMAELMVRGLPWVETVDSDS
ncbi:MAG: saccharopine dehydrogenase family protein [Candidatus Sericytochromatia bacterium]|nr:saccharopine dehydrogenase family protein [Candidatus Sericytochromatia bacterium]